MRRLTAVVFAATLLLVTGLVLPRDTSQAGDPGQPRPYDDLILTPPQQAGYTLGELLEGDAPLDRMPPDVLPAAPAAGPAQSDIRLPEGFTVDFRAYPSPEQLEQFLAELEAAFPDLVETRVIGTSWQGRPITAVRATNERGAQPIADRPVMYIDGQHHARELVSQSVALYTLWRLLDGYTREEPLATHLLETRVLWVVPSVNVDGNAIALADYQNIRKTANPSASDDDGDGAFDEDYSQGYGFEAETLSRFHFTQEWADAHPENPFEDPAWRNNLEGQPELIGRFTGRLGGPREHLPLRDMDGDGQQNEDEIGGVDPNRNYAAFWEQGNPDPRQGTYHGPEVWSEPETRGVRDLLTELDTLAVALSYHSGIDLILHPWGYSDTAELPDAELYERLSRKGSQLTEVHGFPGSPHTWTARGLYGASGSTMDYLYLEHGVYSLSPEVYGDSTLTGVERVGETGAFTVGQSLAAAFNPDPADLPLSVDRWHRFARYLLAAAPNVELNTLEVRDGTLWATAGNDGVIPAEVALRLERPDGTPVTSRHAVSLTLGARTATWFFPADALAREGNVLRAEVRLPSGTVPHTVERAAWTFGYADGEIAVTEGELRPFVDLSTVGEEGGWWADPAWGAPPYLVPGVEPIPVREPSTLFLPALRGE